jgi:hypothetical protein
MLTVSWDCHWRLKAPTRCKSWLAMQWMQQPLLSAGYWYVGYLTADLSPHSNTARANICYNSHELLHLQDISVQRPQTGIHI